MSCNPWISKAPLRRTETLVTFGIRHSRGFPRAIGRRFGQRGRKALCRRQISFMRISRHEDGVSEVFHFGEESTGWKSKCSRVRHILYRSPATNTADHRIAMLFGASSPLLVAYLNKLTGRSAQELLESCHSSHLSSRPTFDGSRLQQRVQAQSVPDQRLVWRPVPHRHSNGDRDGARAARRPEVQAGDALHQHSIETSGLRWPAV